MARRLIMHLVLEPPDMSSYLAAALTIPIFKEYAEAEKSDCINFYRLEKIARVLRLDFDRTKTASKIYRKLEESGYITIVTTPDHRTCIKLTRTGEEKSKQDLESLQTLAEYFHSYPALQSKYTEDKVGQGQLFVSKGASSKSQRTGIDLTINNLINSISNWS